MTSKTKDTKEMETLFIIMVNSSWPIKSSQRRGLLPVPGDTTARLPDSPAGFGISFGLVPYPKPVPAK